jgi:hypothetical protein
VYLRAYDTVGDAETGIGTRMAFYNDQRPHQLLANCTPAARTCGHVDANQPMVQAAPVQAAPGAGQSATHVGYACPWRDAGTH